MPDIRTVERAITGVSDVLEDPMIEIFDDQGNSVATNDNWMDSQMVEIQGTGLAAN